MRNVVILAAALIAMFSAPPLAAKKQPKGAWQVSRTSDPITSATSCIVAAYDRVAGMSFSQSGRLYPFVETSSAHGLLVGVSSGGRMRLPTGDMLWRVDDKPFRTLLVADNPAGMDTTTQQADGSGMAELVGQQMRLIAAATATSTVASGETAQAMLAEMMAGKGLVFRAAAATVSYGLPTGAAREVGQITKDGVRPYPLDDSFRSGLAACGITPAVGL